MKKPVIPSLIFIVYSLFLVKIIVFKDMPLIRLGGLMLNFGGTESGYAPNFIPFKTIYPYLLGYKGWIIAGINLAGNIGLLIPLGLLLPLVCRGIAWKKSLLLAAIGLALEAAQAVLHIGIFDIDDVILNGIGVMIGYWLSAALIRWKISGRPGSSRLASK